MVFRPPNLYYLPAQWFSRLEETRSIVIATFFVDITELNYFQIRGFRVTLGVRDLPSIRVN